MATHKFIVPRKPKEMEALLMGQGGYTRAKSVLTRATPTGKFTARVLDKKGETHIHLEHEHTIRLEGGQQYPPELDVLLEEEQAISALLHREKRDRLLAPRKAALPEPAKPVLDLSATWTALVYHLGEKRPLKPHEEMLDRLMLSNQQLVSDALAGIADPEIMAKCRRLVEENNTSAVQAELAEVARHIMAAVGTRRRR